MSGGGLDREWILTFLKSPVEVLPGASGRVGAVRVEQNRLEVGGCVCVGGGGGGEGLQSCYCLLDHGYNLVEIK